MWLVIGEYGDEISPCSEDFDCPQETLDLAAGFEATALGGGLIYDVDDQEIVGTKIYTTFNVTCAAGYLAAGNTSSAIVTCPFGDSYDANSFTDLACEEIIYESEWCSAGVWVDTDDGDWEEKTSWKDDVVPSEFDLAVLVNGGKADTVTVSLSDDAYAGSLTIENGDGAMVLEIGGDGAAMLVLSEEDPLCGDAMCSDGQLLDNLPHSGYTATGIGSGLAYV